MKNYEGAPEGLALEVPANIAHTETEPLHRPGHSGLKKLLHGASASAMGLGFLLSSAEAGHAAPYTRTVAERSEAALTQEKAKPVSLESIRNTVEHATEEQTYVCGDVGLAECYPVGINAEQRTIYTAAEVLDVARKNGWKTVVVVHTHNLHDYHILGVPGVVQSFEQNGISREAVPPSTIDLVTYQRAVSQIEGGGIKLIEAVAGTTGVWEYSVSSGVWDRSLKAYDAALREAGKLALAAQGPEAAEVVDILGASNNILNYISALESVPKTNALAQKAIALLRTGAKPGQDFESIATEFEWRQLAVGVLRADSDPVVLEAARRSFTSYAASLGIHMRFSPYAKR